MKSNIVKYKVKGKWYAYTGKFPENMDVVEIHEELTLSEIKKDPHLWKKLLEQQPEFEAVC